MAFESTYTSNLVQAEAKEETGAQNHERTDKTRITRYFPYGCPAAASLGHSTNDYCYETAIDESSLDVPAIVPSTPVISPLNASQDDVETLVLEFEETPVVPPSPGPEDIAQINREHEVDPQDLAYALEDVQAFERRVQNIAAFILREFVAGLTRARHQ